MKNGAVLDLQGVVRRPQYRQRKTCAYRHPKGRLSHRLKRTVDGLEYTAGFQSSKIGELRRYHVASTDYDLGVHAEASNISSTTSSQTTVSVGHPTSSSLPPADPFLMAFLIREPYHEDGPSAKGGVISASSQAQARVWPPSRLLSCL